MAVETVAQRRPKSFSVTVDRGKPTATVFKINGSEQECSISAGGISITIPRIGDVRESVDDAIFKNLIRGGDGLRPKEQLLLNRLGGEFSKRTSVGIPAPKEVYESLP